MLHRLSIKHRLWLGFALVFCLVALLVVFAAQKLIQTEDALDDVVEQDVPVLVGLLDMQNSLLQQRIFLREAILARQGGSLFADAESSRKSRAESAKLKALVAQIERAKLDAEDAPHVAKIHKGLDAVIDFSNRLEDALAQGGELDSLLKPAVAARDDLVRELDGFIAHKKQEGTEAAAEAERNFKNALSVMVGLSLAVLFVGGGCALIIVRGITALLGRAVRVSAAIADGDLTLSAAQDSRCEVGQLMRAIEAMRQKLAEALVAVRAAADNSHGLSAQLADQADEAAKRSQSASERLMQVASAMEELTVAIAEVSDSAQGVRTAAQDARRLTDQGRERMGQNLHAVDQIVRTVGESEQAIGHLCDSAGKIGALTEIIRGIAEQTNLLALNAAIEAARAGESGRGFAVVADEVRKLAESTRRSSKDIEQLVKDLAGGTREAIAAMSRVKTDVADGATYTRQIEVALERIAESSCRVGELVLHIASATSQQKVASETTAKSMEEIATLTEENDAVIQNVAVAGRELSSTAMTLRGLVSRFRLAA